MKIRDILAIIIVMENENKEYRPDPSLSDRLLRTRTVIISGEINKDRADEFARQMLVLDSESSDPIYVYINSPGGDVDSGFAIYDMIRYVTSPVTVIGMGLVASAAALIFLSVPAERRAGFPDSTYLIHQPMTEMRGVAADIEIHAQNMEHCRQMTDSIIAQACGRSIEEVHRDTERDHWIYSQGAVEYGLISRVITTKDELK